MFTLPIGTKITSPTTTYTITGVLGSGGFGITYSATFNMTVGSMKAKVNVALKEHFLKDDCQRDEATKTVTYSEPASHRVEMTRKDFISEARRLNSISGKSPNIVTVSEVFEANNTAYYAMEMLEGQSLRDYVIERGRLTESEMLALMTPIVKAVAFLHNNRITHLDIKPQNIMITATEDGHLHPVLIDFGLSKHYNENGEATSTINAQGYSEGYAPIEQYTGITTFSPASDVYSLAATMFFCLTGHKLPRAFDVSPEFLDAELPQDLSRALRKTITKALTLHPEKRQKDAGALFAELSDETIKLEQLTLNQSKSEIPKVVIPRETSSKSQSKFPLKALLIVLAVCLCIGGAVYLFTTSSDHQEQPPQKKKEIADPVLADIELFPIIQNYKMGFADKDGKIVIPCEYDYTTSFCNGLAMVINGDKRGYLDKSGKLVIPIIYDYADPFTDGLAKVLKDGEVGYIDTSGKFVIKSEYDEVFPFSEGMASVRKSDKWGAIDKSGKLVIPLDYDYIDALSEGLVFVKKNNRNYFMDKYENEVIPLGDAISVKFNEGLAPVYKDGKLGFINKSGEFVVPLEYDNVNPFNEGMAPVKKEDKWGFIDKSGKLIIPMVYDDASSFSDGLAYVKKGNQWCGFIDKSGNTVIPLKYNFASAFNSGLAYVNKGGKLGVIDRFNNFKPDKEQPAP